MVPTVDRGLRLADFWSIDTAGDSPSMKSTSGLSIWPRNCLAYADSDSTYRRWPSAKIVSNARLDLPDPDRPVNTIIASRGKSSETSFRLCSRAPRTTSRSATVFSTPTGMWRRQDRAPHRPATTNARHSRFRLLAIGALSCPAGVGDIAAKMTAVTAAPQPATAGPATRRDLDDQRGQYPDPASAAGKGAM